MTTPNPSALAATPTVEEALRALDALGGAYGDEPCERVYIATQALGVIRAALEAAAKEQADWESLREWIRADNTRDGYMLPFVKKQGIECWQMVAGDPKLFARHFDGATRQEALSAAASWCKKERLSR